ncbi:MAG: hypothetical protein OK436_06825 [Thaumarchaeota archaeon]|nr:hypothetical protein [Nitrososphaerota archaeon]
MGFRPKDVDDVNEPLVISLLHNGWMAVEERDYPFLEVPQSIDCVGHYAACASLGPNSAAAEERDKCVKNEPCVLMLVDVEDRIDLPAKRPNTGMRMDRHGEATFSVNESHHPLGIELEP